MCLLVACIPAARLTRAVSGRAAPVQPTNAMNSRRLMASPTPRTMSGMKRISHFWIENCAVRYRLTGHRSCPLWVKSGRRSTSARCLLYPRKRTLIDASRSPLRAIKATCASLQVMSGLAPISDVVLLTLGTKSGPATVRSLTASTF
jgi:hypothetical protein